MDREKVIKATELLDDYFNEYREVYQISPHEAWEIIKDTLKEQEEQIEQLEYDLAVTQNNLNYFVNGND